MQIASKIKNIDKNEEIDLLKLEINKLKKSLKKKDSILDLQSLILDSSLNSTLITDYNGNIIWINKAFVKQTGFSFDEIISKKPNILKSGVHNDEFYKNIWDVIKKGKSWEGEITNKRKDGTLYHTKQIIKPIFNSKNEVTNFIATKQDITDHKKANEALNEMYIMYEELAYIFNQSPAIGFLWSESEQRSIELVTDNIKQWGYTPEEFYSQKKSFNDIIYKKDKRRVLKELSEKLDSKKERLKQHFRIVNKSGEIRWVDSHLYVRLGENDTVTHLQGVMLDVTEKKIAEDEAKYQLEQLMQADKMIALGTLVSGVAHEINNPNNFVILNIPLIEKVWFNTLPILDEYYEKNGDFNVSDRLMFSKIKKSMPLLLGGINEGSQRIKNIVEDLKSFARKDELGFKQGIDLNKVVQTAVNLTANLVSKSTDNFVVKYKKNPVYVKGNKQKLEQVLINLIENSCQALTSRKQSVKIEIIKTDDCGHLIVADKGIGIPKEVLRKITDPFFTTKRNSGGTGLGLSITSKIIMMHKGTLLFDSEPNKGTIATIKIPLKKD